MKLKKINKKIIAVILIICISLISTTAYGIYKIFTIGSKSLTFTINAARTNPLTNLNAPELIDGMIPVVWDETNSKWKVVSSTDTSWYDYSEGTAKWANIMMADTTATDTNVGALIDESNLGSMFVWIPKFEYKITYYTDSSRTVISPSYTRYGKIDVNLVSKATTTATSGFTIHPAFQNGTSNGFLNGEWDSEIGGFWMSKFELSGSDTTLKSIPNVSSKNLINIGGTTSNKGAYQISKDQTYGITNNAAALNSHMTKNSEWGAVSYFSYSSFGLMGIQPDCNNYKNSSIEICTGYSGGSSTAQTVSSINSANVYNTSIGVRASTTGNIYGVYDMNGGRNEFTSAYLTGTTDLTEEISTSVNSKYYTSYSQLPSSGSSDYAKLIQVSKPGDGLGETMLWDLCCDGLATGTNRDLVYLSTTNNHFLRGGAMTNGLDSLDNAVTTGMGSGTFSFVSDPCESNSYRGFRTVLTIE